MRQLEEQLLLPKLSLKRLTTNTINQQIQRKMKETCFHQQKKISRKIQVMCFGQYEVGRSKFLQMFTDQKNTSSQQFKEYCDVYVKLVQQPNRNQLIGVELYDFPSHHNFTYYDCYLMEKFDGIIFFYDMKIKRTLNSFAKILRKLQKYRNIWKLPILVVGLKRNLVDAQDQILDKNYLKNIINMENIIYVAQKLSEANKKSMSKYLDVLVKQKQNEMCEYYLMQTNQTYFYLYSYRELINFVLNISKKYITEKLKKDKKVEKVE